jgi:dTDP-L-rhamnose 4-epimerase
MLILLVTGDAGFIGSHNVTALTGAGHAVRVLDAQLPSAHRTAPRIPPGVDRQHADVRDRAAVTHALRAWPPSATRPRWSAPART